VRSWVLTGCPGRGAWRSPGLAEGDAWGGRGGLRGWGQEGFRWTGGPGACGFGFFLRARARVQFRADRAAGGEAAGAVREPGGPEYRAPVSTNPGQLTSHSAHRLSYPRPPRATVVGGLLCVRPAQVRWAQHRGELGRRAQRGGGAPGPGTSPRCSNEPFPQRARPGPRLFERPVSFYQPGAAPLLPRPDSIKGDLDRAPGGRPWICRRASHHDPRFVLTDGPAGGPW